jgi:hypothetical protein
MIGAGDFLELLSYHLNNADKPLALLQAMKAGDILIPGDQALEPLPLRTRLVRQLLEKSQLGFDEASLLEGSHTVKGLVEGSRAQRAGLRNGDRVEMLYGSAWAQARNRFRATLQLKVFRPDSATFVVEFWPRSWETAEAYMYEIIENNEL